MRIALMGGVRSTAPAVPARPMRRRRADMRAIIIPVTPFQQNCSLVWCAETQAGRGDRSGWRPRQDTRRGRTGRRHAQQDPADARAHRPRRRRRRNSRASRTLPIVGPHPGDQFWIDGLAEQGRMFGFAHVREFRAGPVARRWRPCQRRQRRVRRAALPRAHAGSRHLFFGRRTGSLSSVTCCSRARSGAPIFRAATTTR